jgi:hypothetical protein
MKTINPQTIVFITKIFRPLPLRQPGLCLSHHASVFDQGALSLAILNYPTSIENINLRKHERLASLIAAEVSVKGKMYEGIIPDISSGGCSFEFSKSDQRTFPDLKFRDTIAISMLLQETSEATVFNAQVLTVLTDPENMLAGLQFIPSGFQETDAKSERELNDYIRAQQSNL